METMERIWHTLFRRKKKKYATPEPETGEAAVSGRGDKQSVENLGPISDEPQRVTVKTAVVGENKTFPRSNFYRPEANESSPAMPRLKRDPVAASSTSLRGRKFDDPYDKSKWTSTQHFHVPPGTRPRHASSRGALSMQSVHTSSRRQLSRPLSSNSLRPHTPVIEQHNNLRRPVEPYDKIKDQGGLQHFHLPKAGGQASARILYNRSGGRGGMNKMVQNIQNNVQPRPRSPSINNEEPIQLAHYPSGHLKYSPNEELPSIFPFSESERKRRRSRSEDSQSEDQEHEEADEELDGFDDKLRRNEETLDKMQNGIGKVFLDTIRKTEKIRNEKVHQIDPRSAARTPAANKMPKYRLRYDSPAWASPSRDTYHGRPWDSEEDISHPVVLTSSGCASGCASDHLPNARSTRDLQSARSHSTLVRSVPSLPGAGTLRHSTPVRPGYTHASTMPHIRSVSGRIIAYEADVDQQVNEGTKGVVGNSHSGVVSTVSNSFSWATLARFQEDTSNKNTSSTNKFFQRPELKHKRTILDI